MLHFSDSYNCLNEWVLKTLKENNANWKNIISEIPHIDGYIDNLKAYFDLNKVNIKKRISMCKNLWSGYEKRFEECMSNLFYSDEVVDSLAYVTFFPLYPRDIEHHIFLIPFASSDDLTISIMVHEQIHFYYYSMLECCGVTNYCKQNTDNVKISEKTLWLIGEILVPIIFEYLENNYFFSNLKCSGYCFTDFQKEKIRDAFNRYFVYGNFIQFILLSNRILKREH
jgi:hypothetical protein